MMMDPNCEICGVVRNLDRHHVIPKRMGGRKDPAIHDEDNLMTLCRNCHRNLHEGQWELVRSSEGIWVFDKHTGDQVMRRLYDPDVAPSALFQVLNVA
ncbi:MAG: HNH endonuclease [Chloroflexi bacterium]|nr:HNH endonuclease [Chloroflexota bacterium]